MLDTRLLPSVENSGDRTRPGYVVPCGLIYKSDAMAKVLCDGDGDGDGCTPAPQLATLPTRKPKGPKEMLVVDPCV